MSGGHFDHQQWHIREIAETIERDIARALKPKPAMVHEDYWVIYEMYRKHSFRKYCEWRNFDSYEEAEAFLLRNDSIEKATSEYISDGFFNEGIIFQSKYQLMSNTKDEELIPVLYSIQHCVYDHYPYDEDVLELTDKSIETMKEAYRQLRIAEIYATRIDWMMSDDDGEDTMQERLAEDLQAFEHEFKSKDWHHLDSDED